MSLKLFFKLATLLGLFIVLMIATLSIHAMVRERQMLRDKVVQDIARSAGYAQQVTGPLIVVPYTRRMTERETLGDGGTREVLRTVSGRLHLLPAEFSLAGKLGTEERRRGIYRARVFDADTSMQASFDLPAHYGITEDIASYDFGAPLLTLGISDIRGIRNALTLDAGGRQIAFEPGSATPILASGVQAKLGAHDVATPLHLEATIALNLQGTGSFMVTPVGRETRVTLKSDWPHPGFVGEFLPRSPDVSNTGFSAQWQTSFFATNVEQLLAACAGVDGNGSDERGCAAFKARSFGVEFVDPVDQYLKSERAVKYAFLFIGLTFGGFFLFEVLRNASVHPVQYGLTGFSLAMFFLLLFALSEHVGFALAYLVAAAACVLLNGYYVSHVLGGVKQGAGFGAALAGLYGLLYGILASEDYALLMGTLLVFALLGVTMVLTRRVNWARVGEVRS